MKPRLKLLTVVIAVAAVASPAHAYFEEVQIGAASHQQDSKP